MPMGQVLMKLGQIPKNVKPASVEGTETGMQIIC